ncbi:glycosyltransferase family 2 protein [Methylophaga sp. SB9B]|uniref:glycosyltransferase family 2 protein n=1 Tax=Methylophaga sp. SB9B TaxID=2570356 RepID=UPI0010A81ECA|nr:glycosyltransferase [Methylophaga sp. SB9B]THK43287.1 glycosyltransferase family 2 protein [Methylophaga sp. SB9B]
MSQSISISIVSHGQAELVKQLLADLDGLVNKTVIKEIILTLNMPEEAEFTVANLPIQIIYNSFPKGFSSNHNTAFDRSTGDYFCVLNPDIRLVDNPFLVLLENIQELKLGMIAPMIVDSKGHPEDSVRKFPTVGRLIKRLINGKHDTYSFFKKDEVFYPDWVGGMFMLFDRKAYQAVKGFDQGYFLYYEDVDICVRLWQKDFPIAVLPQTQVIHQAQRQSHKQLKYLRWHLVSMLRFFIKHTGRLPKTLTRN